MIDVIVIGGGIIGSATARELGRYKLNVLVLERASELAEGTSKANSGIVHAGHDCEPGSQKSKFNTEGNLMFDSISKDLDFPFKRNGSMVLAFSEHEASQLVEMADKAKINKVPNFRIIDKEEILQMERNVNADVVKAFLAESGSITSPYEAVIAYAENAFMNGVKFEFLTEVQNITLSQVDGAKVYTVHTNNGDYQTRAIVNAAGLYSDQINNMINQVKYTIVPRKGEYLLFDKSTKGFANHTLFQVPTPFGKGVLVTPTVHDNLIIGPSAEDTHDKTSKSTTQSVIEKVMQTARKSISCIPTGQIITSFAGLRANLSEGDDFVIDMPISGFVNAIGINSPGLSAAPSIAVHIASKLAEYLEPKMNTDFVQKRMGIKIFRELDIEEQNRLIVQNGAYGKIVCRCETVTEAEVVDAIKRPLGATTIDGVKRRTRSGGGRCQGGFCGSKVLEILARELNIPMHEVTKFGGKSNMILENRDI